MKICGIDYSITSPAVAVIGDGYTRLYGWTGKKHHFWAKKDNDFIIDVLPYPHYDNEIERLYNLAQGIYDAIQRENPQHCFIEGYSFGANGKVFNIAEGCGIMKFLLYQDDILPTDISPGTIKKHATGKGNAKKPEMVDQFIKDTGIDIYEVFGKKRGLKTIPSPITDLVDAYYIAKCGLTTIPNPQTDY